MSNSRMSSTFFVAAPFVALAFGSLGLAQAQVESKDKEQTDIKLLQQDLTKVIDLQQKESKDIHELQEIIRSLKPYQTGGGGTNMPLKVRGGSMTVRTADSDGWQDVTTVPASPQFCTNVNPSYIELTGVTPGAAVPPGPVPLVISKIPLNFVWQIDVVGRSPGGASVSGNGIRLTSQSSGCPTGSSSSSVLLSTQSGGNSAFYPNESALTESNTHSKRFMDTTAATATHPGCQSSPSSAGDEDLCERISKVTLTLTPPSGGTQITYTYKCPNGECSIGIGTQ